MSEIRDFRTEYQAFVKEYPYQTIEVQGEKIRYQLGGKDGAPVILFFHGLEMKEMWMAYAQHFRDNYRFLIYEYPLHTAKADEQIAFAYDLLKALSIQQVILIGGSDGGVYAQIFAKKYPELVEKMILITTLTLDSEYLRNIQKKRFAMPFLTFMLNVLPAKSVMNMLLKKSPGFLKCETPEGQAYGTTFYEAVVSDLSYKERYIHSVKCVYELKDYPWFKASDFEYLRGKVQIFIPQEDIFLKEDQERLAALFRKVDAEILNVAGGHLSCVVRADEYLAQIDRFLEEK